jgi:4-amino-4-deoxy-L-arabinose transferase-like glycosyltransferase
MASPLRLLSARAVPYVLVGLTLLKLVLFFGLESAGKTRPVVGDNAVDFSLPVAERLIHEGRYNGPDSRSQIHYPPGYPVLLAASMLASSQHYLTLMVALQMLIDLSLAYLLFWAGSRFASWQTGLVAAVVWLLFPPEVVISTWITQESIYTALLTAAVLVLIVALPKETAGLALSAGLLLGVATLFRPTAMYFPFFLLPFWYLSSYPRRWRKAFYLVLGVACVVAPWTIRNYLVLDEKILVSTGYGAARFQSSDERMYTIAGKRKWYPIMYAEASRAGIVKPASDKESDIDRWMLQIALWNYGQRWEQRPWSFVPFFGQRFFRIWYGNESGVLRSQAGLGLCSLLFAPLGAWQLWRWRRRVPELSVVAGLLVLYFWAVHMIVGPYFRYVLPVFPWLILAWAVPVAGWFFPDVKESPAAA